MNRLEDDKQEDNQTLVSRCYFRLREGIITGELAPGEKLKVAKLTSLLAVGPTPVREALSRLASTGLITAVDNKGFRVKEVSKDEAHDLYFAFKEMEKIVLRLAIEHGKANWEGEVIASLHRLSLIENSRTAKFADWFHANEAFHYSLVSACGSPVLLKIRDDLLQLMGRYTFLSFKSGKQKMKRNHEEHEKIARAAINRDASTACRLMDAHLSGSSESIAEWLKHVKKPKG